MNVILNRFNVKSNIKKSKIYKFLYTIYRIFSLLENYLDDVAKNLCTD